MVGYRLSKYRSLEEGVDINERAGIILNLSKQFSEKKKKKKNQIPVVKAMINPEPNLIASLAKIQWRKDNE